MNASAEKFSPVTIQKLTVTVGKAVGSTAKLRAKGRGDDAVEADRRGNGHGQGSQRGDPAAAAQGGERGRRQCRQGDDRQDDRFERRRGGHARARRSRPTTSSSSCAASASATAPRILNGSRLPSTDPNKRIMPLDIFPADFIDALNIIKTYTPDLPGDFAGGLIESSSPSRRRSSTYSLGASMSFNTETTFRVDTYTAPATTG